MPFSAIDHHSRRETRRKEEGNEEHLLFYNVGSDEFKDIKKKKVKLPNVEVQSRQSSGGIHIV